MGAPNIVWREHRCETVSVWIGVDKDSPKRILASVTAEAGIVIVLDWTLDSMGRPSTSICRSSGDVELAARWHAVIGATVRLAWERAADLATIAGLAAEGLAA